MRPPDIEVPTDYRDGDPDPGAEDEFAGDVADEYSTCLIVPNPDHPAGPDNYPVTHEEALAIYQKIFPLQNRALESAFMRAWSQLSVYDCSVLADWEKQKFGITEEQVKAGLSAGSSSSPSPERVAKRLRGFVGRMMKNAVASRSKKRKLDPRPDSPLSDRDSDRIGAGEDEKDESETEMEEEEKEEVAEMLQMKNKALKLTLETPVSPKDVNIHKRHLKRLVREVEDKRGSPPPDSAPTSKQSTTSRRSGSQSSPTNAASQQPKRKLLRQSLRLAKGAKLSGSMHLTRREKKGPPKNFSRGGTFQQHGDGSFLSIEYYFDSRSCKFRHSTMPETIEEKKLRQDAARAFAVLGGYGKMVNSGRKFFQKQRTKVRAIGNLADELQLKHNYDTHENNANCRDIKQR
eukprot:g2300.t1